MEDISSFGASPPSPPSMFRSKKKAILIGAGIAVVVLVILGISIAVIAAAASSGTTKEEQEKIKDENYIKHRKTETDSNNWWAGALNTIGDIFMWLFIIMGILFLLRTFVYWPMYWSGNVDYYNDLAGWLIDARGWIFDKISIGKYVKKGINKLRKRPTTEFSSM